jgi:MFS family permease
MTPHDSPWRALSHRNFSLFLIGRGLTLCGMWMQTMAQAWLLYRLTNSPFLLGVLECLLRGPLLVFGLFGGVLADRWPRHRLLIWAQSLLLVQAALLATLTLSGHVTAPWILGLGLLFGLISAVDVPVRQAFVTDLVPRHDIPSAIGLNSSIFNASRIVGPTLAGGLVVALGEGPCFLISAMGFLMILGCLSAMEVPEPSLMGQGHMRAQLREGLRYVWRTPHARAMLLLSAGLSVVAMPYTTLLPVFARDVLQGNAAAMGWLMGANGVGALAAALRHARRRSTDGLAGSIVGAVAMFGVGLLLLAVSRHTWLSLLALVGIGYGMVSSLAGGNILLQMAAPEGLRGRVASLYATISLGTTIFGSLLAGFGASYAGAPLTVAVGGALTLTLAGWSWTALRVSWSNSHASDDRARRTPLRPSHASDQPTHFAHTN